MIWSRKVNPLGVQWYTERMRVFVTEETVARVKNLDRKLLLTGQRNKRFVPFGLVQQFCGVCASLTLAIPLVKFYTKRLYLYMSLEDMKEAMERDGG